LPANPGRFTNRYQSGVRSSIKFPPKLLASWTFPNIEMFSLVPDWTMIEVVDWGIFIGFDADVEPEADGVISA